MLEILRWIPFGTGIWLGYTAMSEVAFASEPGSACTACFHWWWEFSAISPESRGFFRSCCCTAFRVRSKRIPGLIGDEQPRTARCRTGGLLCLLGRWCGYRLDVSASPSVGFRQRSFPRVIAQRRWPDSTTHPCRGHRWLGYWTCVYATLMVDSPHHTHNSRFHPCRTSIAPPAGRP